MPISSVTRNNKCIKLNKKYRAKREELKKQMKLRRVDSNISIHDQISLMFQLDKLPKKFI